jgi:hypothetical protein
MILKNTLYTTGTNNLLLEPYCIKMEIMGRSTIVVIEQVYPEAISQICEQMRQKFM